MPSSRHGPPSEIIRHATSQLWSSAQTQTESGVKYQDSFRSTRHAWYLPGVRPLPCNHPMHEITTWISLTVQVALSSSGTTGVHMVRLEQACMSKFPWNIHNPLH